MLISATSLLGILFFAGYLWMFMCECGGQRTTFRNQFSPSLWGPGLYDLPGKHFTHRAISFPLIANALRYLQWLVNLETWLLCNPLILPWEYASLSRHLDLKRGICFWGTGKRGAKKIKVIAPYWEISTAYLPQRFSISVKSSSLEPVVWCLPCWTELVVATSFLHKI